MHNDGFHDRTDALDKIDTLKKAWREQKAKKGDIALHGPKVLQMSSAGGAFRFCGWEPGRLWSLWEMLKVSAKEYIELGQAITDVSAGLYAHSVLATSEELSVEERDRVKNNLVTVFEHCINLHLDVSGEFIAKHSQIETLPKTSREYDFLIDAVFAELKTKLFLFIPPHIAKYYECDDLVSEEVTKAFPKASEEMRLAGTCLATGSHTACVFHAMRAAEIGLRALGTGFSVVLKSGKPLEMAEWREILDGLSAAVLAVENLPNSTPTKDADLLFLSEACAQFRFFKGGWRIRVAHARATYLEPQAIEALDHVRSFFEILAHRLKE